MFFDIRYILAVAVMKQGTSGEQRRAAEW